MLKYKQQLNRDLPHIRMPYAQTSDFELNRVYQSTSGGAHRMGNLVPPLEVYSSSMTYRVRPREKGAPLINSLNQKVQFYRNPPL